MIVGAKNSMISEKWGCYVLTFLSKDVRDEKNANIDLQKWLS